MRKVIHGFANSLHKNFDEETMLNAFVNQPF